jgi:hypothetical protein
MLLDLRCELRAGDELELVLHFEDGAEQTLTAAVRDYAGAQEEYDPGHGEGHSQDDSGGDSQGDGGGHAGDHTTGSGTGPSAGPVPAADLPGCRG